jgi:DNA polymerase III psi subunit/DNA-binding Xre family transcriptional regulator
MSTAYLFEGLKAHYRARGLNYRDVAKALKISEATVKRIFFTRDCTLARLEELCAVVQVDIAEIARGAPRTMRLITQLTKDQEQELVDDLRLLIVAVCAMGNVLLADIVRVYDISQTQCIGLLAKLDRIGFLDLQENNHYRLLVARTFQWIPDGPIMRWTKQQASDYFNYPFMQPGEMLRIVNVRVSAEARVALLARMEQLALEYAEQHNADSWLPLEQRETISLCLAVRPWEPAAFGKLWRVSPR